MNKESQNDFESRRADYGGNPDRRLRVDFRGWRAYIGASGYIPSPRSRGTSPIGIRPVVRVFSPPAGELRPLMGPDVRG